MKQELIEYYDELYLHTNNIPHAQQTEHIRKKEIVNKTYKHKTVRDGTTYESTVPLIKITRGTCPECDCHTYSYDMWRGEKVCPQCGLVLEEGLAQQPIHQTAYRKPKRGYTYQEKKFLRKYGHHKFTTDTKEWLENCNNKMIKALSNQAMLNKNQEMQVKYILDTMGYKKLHSRATQPQIISAVIRYVLKQSYTVPALLRYNQNIFKELLTKEIYDVVERNIKNYYKMLNNEEQHPLKSKNKKGK